MKKRLDTSRIRDYVETHIGDFHNKRLEKLQALKLRRVLRRKNPYLFKAKNIQTAEGFVRYILDAYLSSQEETLFGDFLEGLAIFICQQVYDAYRPDWQDLTGVDLIFSADDEVYVVEIKSGPNWGNSSQIKKMLDNFALARQKLQAQYPHQRIIAVNGCAYGRNNVHSQRDGAYWKLCGQDFWRFISGDDDLYLGIIEPLGHRAKLRNEAFDTAYAELINRFTLEFAQTYCKPSGAIDWVALVAFVSARGDDSPYPF